MSTLEWRREQPRVNPPRHPAQFWLDVITLGWAAIVFALYVWLFASEGWMPGLWWPLAGGWAMAHWYPFAGAR